MKKKTLTEEERSIIANKVVDILPNTITIRNQFGGTIRQTHIPTENLTKLINYIFELVEVVASPHPTGKDKE